MITCKELDFLLQQFNIARDEKIIQYIMTIGVDRVRNELQEINKKTIKQLAKKCRVKDQDIKNELVQIKIELCKISQQFKQETETTTNGYRNSTAESQIKKKNSELTLKVTESPAPLIIPKHPTATKFRHHLDDSEIKQVLWTQQNENSNLGRQRAFSQKIESNQTNVQRCLNLKTEESVIPEQYAQEKENKIPNKKSVDQEKEKRNFSKKKNITKKKPIVQNDMSQFKNVQSKIRSKILEDKLHYKMQVNQHQEEQYQILNDSLEQQPNEEEKIIPTLIQYQGDDQQELKDEQLQILCQFQQDQSRQNYSTIDLKNDQGNLSKNQIMNIANSFLNSPFMAQFQPTLSHIQRRGIISLKLMVGFNQIKVNQCIQVSLVIFPFLLHLMNLKVKIIYVISRFFPIGIFKKIKLCPRI